MTSSHDIKLKSMLNKTKKNHLLIKITKESCRKVHDENSLHNAPTRKFSPAHMKYEKEILIVHLGFVYLVEVIHHV